MGLTAQDLGSMARLSQLAADPKSARRGDIYLAIASLYQSQAPRLSERERSLMREILQRLAGDVEMAIRISLAERLAEDDDAPLDLILLLADDRIEVARPVILRSRQLTDEDLLSLLGHASDEHQLACAERPHIGEPVTDRLAHSGSESVLIALVRNATARIARAAFETLIDKSRQIAALQAPLVQRTDLPPALATRMCEWVSEALRDHIRVNFPEGAPAAQAKLGEATLIVQTPGPVASTGMGAAKLVDKLAAAGQLKAGFLLRVLHQGQLELFEIAFARLLGIDPKPLRHLLFDAGPASLALACRSAGIDRCVFGTVFNLTRQALQQRATLTRHEQMDVDDAFERFTKVEALQRLRELAAAQA